jgi:hypothetical protein
MRTVSLAKSQSSRSIIHTRYKRALRSAGEAQAIIANILGDDNNSLGS